MTAMNKRLLISESHDDSNWCTPCRGNRSTRHTLSTINFHRVPNPTSHVVCVGNHSLVPTRTKQAPTPGRSLSDQRQTCPTVVLGHLIPLPHDSLGVGERGFGQMVTQIHHLTGLISLACDRHVRYLLTCTNPSVLNQHRWGLPHRNLRIATSLSPPFPSKCSTGPPNWPHPISILSDIKHRFQGSSLKGSISATWYSDHSAIYHNLHLYLAIASGLSLVIGSTRMDWKVILM
jgi:hypothetical protein